MMWNDFIKIIQNEFCINCEFKDKIAPCVEKLHRICFDNAMEFMIEGGLE